jgi:hypothetical protein
LLTFFEQDDNTTIIAQHCVDFEGWRLPAGSRRWKKKPIVMFRPGCNSMGACAASPHTGFFRRQCKI